MKIFLIGLPGSGKTTMGKSMAKALAIPFVDLDKEIERREGRIIREIFKDKSEDYFRVLETNELASWCESDKSFVMATGGGAPCFFGNMDLINKSGTSIFLDIPPAEIVKRIQGTSVEERPLLAAGGTDALKETIETLRTQRLQFYRKARLTFGVSVTPEEVVSAVRK